MFFSTKHRKYLQKANNNIIFATQNIQRRIMKDTSSFSIKWLRAMAHMSRRMQDRIIADVTRWQLTGEIPEKMSAMRRALFNTFILELDPEANLAPDRLPKEPKKPKEPTMPKLPKPPTSPKQEYPDYMIPLTQPMLDRFINDPSGYGVLVDNAVPEFTVPLSEVRRVFAEWKAEGRRYLTYKIFRDELVYEFHKEQIDRYRRDHPVPISAW